MLLMNSTRIPTTIPSFSWIARTGFFAHKIKKYAEK